MKMASEYIFFDESLRDQFMNFVAGHSVASSTRPDPIEGWVVELPDELADSLQVAVETEYDALMDKQRELADAAEGTQARDLMGVTVTLPSGESCLVRLPAAYGRRLVEHFTFEEIHELVSIIAQNVANPVSGPMCRDV
jgi:hypothetical protein